MEVPTLVSFSSFQQQTVEQVIGVPVPGRGGELGGLQGLHRGQSSTAFLEQIAESPDPGGRIQDFRPVQGSVASPSVSPGLAVEGVFRTFPRSEKKSDFRRESECEGARALELIHAVFSSRWCRAS